MPTDIPVLIPEYINVRGYSHSVKNLLLLCEPRRLADRSAHSEHHEFELLPPYTKWPPGYSKFSAGTRIQHKKCHGVILTRTLLLSPIWLNKKRCGLCPTTVPFIAMRYLLQPQSVPSKFYWQFWFQDDQTIQHILETSPPGKWLAKGYHNHEKHLLPTKRYHCKHTIPSDTT